MLKKVSCFLLFVGLKSVAFGAAAQNLKAPLPITVVKTPRVPESLKSLAAQKEAIIQEKQIEDKVWQKYKVVKQPIENSIKMIDLSVKTTEKYSGLLAEALAIASTAQDSLSTKEERSNLSLNLAVVLGQISNLATKTCYENILLLNGHPDDDKPFSFDVPYHEQGLRVEFLMSPNFNYRMTFPNLNLDYMRLHDIVLLTKLQTERAHSRLIKALEVVFCLKARLETQRTIFSLFIDAENAHQKRMADIRKEGEDNIKRIDELLKAL